MATATLPRSTDGKLRRSLDDVFFPAMAILILATVFVGFARTYFLAGVFRAPLPNLLIHIHGAVFSTWILLLIAQTTLVSTGRVDIHRRLGLAGFGLACLVVILGVLAASNSLARGFSPPGSPFDPKTFYAIPLGDMLMFATLVFFAYRARFNPAAHKRLILIATIAMLDAPTGRPPFTVITARPFLDSTFVYLFLLLLVGYDLWSTRKVHRATAWASAFVVVLGQLRVPIGKTVLWHSFASWAQTLARGSH
ncbi:MAG: hypothetical protein LAO24_22015 [Acidobacteriia bacterium]|nr:hypothetical protein [Terriglobia bacterium]